MALLRSRRGSAYDHTLHTLALQLGTVVLIAAAATLSLLLVQSAPLPLVMPVLSLVSFLVAGVVALFAICSGADRHASGITPWNVAGGAALIWVVAGMLSRPEHVVQLMAQITMAQ